jgi:hypothetical protein
MMMGSLMVAKILITTALSITGRVTPIIVYPPTQDQTQMRAVEEVMEEEWRSSLFPHLSLDRNRVFVSLSEPASGSISKKGFFSVNYQMMIMGSTGSNPSTSTEYQ